ncbi:MAG TPA: TlpA disulfide reductase family protein [Thermoanaerobaculia bacterium]|nr:TlpA disulfide reductase family protein [Thermoanaerobaculia bacterium]
MRAFVPFAVFCLSITPASAANLVEIKDPARLMESFSPRPPVRVLNVWATWCVPCVEEMEDLQTISDTFGTRVSLLGISLDDMIPGDRTVTKQKVTKFLDSKRITYINIYYSGNSDALADKLRFNGEIPITIIYDRHGRETWRQQGKLDRNKAIAAIRKQLGGNR